MFLRNYVGQYYDRTGRDRRRAAEPDLQRDPRAGAEHRAELPEAHYHAVPAAKNYADLLG
jgi:hypothetical protein